MSKAALKKELAGFSREQLVQIILDTYSSSREAKEYFEFFLNPDVEALRVKKHELLAKELRREKWGYSKARISQIRKILKDYESFNVGDAAMEQLCLDTLRMLIGTEYYIHFTPALKTGTAAIATQMIEYGIKNDNLEAAMDNLTKALNTLATHEMRNLVKLTVDNFLSNYKKIK